ncbi:MAG: DNA polymerase III subunit beta [Steroidobacteraceae bacterium]
MKFSADRESILVPLLAVIGVVEKRQTMPILANVLLVAKDQTLTITASDLEVELSATGAANIQAGGEITLPGRKLLDIIKALPEKAQVTLSIEAERAIVRSGKSRFTLATLSASDFPVVENIDAKQKFSLPQSEIKTLLEKTHFSMAQQDVRYYLNGLLFELTEQQLRLVATDGHRLALAEAKLNDPIAANLQVILPRKGVLELQRILGTQGEIEISISSNHMRVSVDGVRFTSKLIDGRFPDYGRVIPDQPTRIVSADRLNLRTALQRAAILSNEKYRGIRLTLKPGLLVLQAHNPEQEEAEEELEVGHTGESMEIGFNVNYLMEALAAVEGEQVELGFTDGNSSCLIKAPGGVNSRFVVMPMRL